MKKILLATLVLLAITAFALSSQLALAQGTCVGYDQCLDGCTYSGGCGNGNRICEAVPDLSDPSKTILRTGAQPCGDTVLGHIETPMGVDNYNANAARVGGSIGLLIFFNRLIKIVNIVAGLFVMANFIIAGFEYITMAGNPEAGQKVKNRLIFSLVGIVIVISAYAGAAIIGLVFFDDAGFVLRPDIAQYGALQRP